MEADGEVVPAIHSVLLEQDEMALLDPKKEEPAKFLDLTRKPLGLDELGRMLRNSIAHYTVAEGDPSALLELVRGAASSLVWPTASAEERRQVVDAVRAGHEAARQSGRFVQWDADQVGPDDASAMLSTRIEGCIRSRVPQLFPELAEVKLFV